MDRLTALIALAHVKLRAEYIQRHPEILESLPMVPKFAGLSQALGLMRHELETQAQDLMNDITSTTAEAKDAFGQARQEVGKAKAAVADVKAFVADLKGGNGGPTSSDSSGSSDQSQLEKLTTNGISVG
jgi:hypothetical protein